MLFVIQHLSATYSLEKTVLGLEKKREVKGHKTIITYVVNKCSLNKNKPQKQELGYRNKPFSSKAI